MHHIRIIVFHVEEVKLLDNKIVKKKKKFNIFDSQREGKGVEKGEVKTPNFKNFFKYFGRSFTRLLSVNLMFTFFCLPLLFALFAMAGYLDTNAPVSLYPLANTLEGLMLNGEYTPVTMSLYGVYGIPTGTANQISLGSVILYAISAVTVFTWGFANISLMYNIRNIQRGEPVYVWADTFYVIKRNFVQALIYGIIDLGIIALLIYDIYVYSINTASMFYTFMYYLSIFMIVVYVVMRPYIYLMMVTFDLSIFKLIKNAFIFAFAALGRNVLMLVGLIVAVILNMFIIGILTPLGMMLPFVLTVGVMGYIMVYAAYPKIKEIMITPYEEEESGEEDVDMPPSEA